MYTCPNCHATRYQVNDGVTGAGSQRVRCRTCGKRYTPHAKPQGYTPEHRRQAFKLYRDGMNFRRIARHVGVQHQTVINGVNAAAEQVPSAPPVPEQVDVVELDELYIFVERTPPASTS